MPCTSSGNSVSGFPTDPSEALRNALVPHWKDKTAMCSFEPTGNSCDPIVRIVR